MGMFVNYFFAGFILGKVPFQLSPSFRPMLQVPPPPPPPAHTQVQTDILIHPCMGARLCIALSHV